MIKLAPNTKICSKCKQEKELSDYYKRDNGRTVQSQCKECQKAFKKEARKSPKHIEYIREYNKQWRLQNPEKIKAWNKKNSRNAMLKSLYGLSELDYNILFNKQKGKCAICDKHQSEFKKPLCVDHNHETSKIRGLLCHNCNVSLGLLKDNIDVLEKAIEYLKQHS